MVAGVFFIYVFTIPHSQEYNNQSIAIKRGMITFA